MILLRHSLIGLLVSSASAQDLHVQGAEPVQSPEVDQAAGDDSVLYEGALSGVIDGVSFSETSGYRRMLELVGRYGEEEIASKVEREFDFLAALAAPSAWRGKIVHARGLLAGIDAVRLDEPINGHVDAYRATLVEMDGSVGMIVDFLERPPELELRHDVVDVVAVFYRTLRYENRLGVTQEAPYLIARGIHRAPETAPRSTKLDTFGMVLIGAAFVLVTVRVLNMLRGQGQQRAQVEAEKRSRLLRERARLVRPTAKRPPPLN